MADLNIPKTISLSHSYACSDLIARITGGITSLSVTIVIRRATGLSVNGQFNTMGGQMTQSVTITPTTFVFQFNLVPGQTLQPEPNRVCAAQTSGSGTTHPTSGDTATITYTSGGVTRTETRTF